jgi:XTP/dITP diphosphohydrolase
MFFYQSSHMHRTLIFATSNPHKVSEVRALAGDALTIRTMHESGFGHITLNETSDSLQGNAIQKAEDLYLHSRQDCFAEDAGLEVAALGGAPGVFTARYAGEHGDPAQNIQKLLHEMTGISDRRARFRTIIALILDARIHCFEGIVEGTIAGAPRGNGGFGYDPVFIPDGYDQTFAELSADVKNILSHRAIAFKKMLAFLQVQDQR